MVPLMMLLISCDADTSTNGVTWVKSHHTSFWSSWSIKCSGAIFHTFVIMWCQDKCQWPRMTKNHAAPHNVILRPASMVLHDQNSSVPHCCICLGLINTMVPLPITLTSHDADVSANSVKWLKKSCCISFWSSWNNRYSCGIDDPISVLWCQQALHNQKSCCTSVQ